MTIWDFCNYLLPLARLCVIRLISLLSFYAVIPIEHRSFNSTTRLLGLGCKQPALSM
ncbi:hypothetical protein FA95DRAFT_1566842 [Auriscalpium vulgare]|uniref:Uncharacterized protein n=1 Tax=Auriscalpium vulgare TaxID=40419 RepID=A0ACB8R8I2_9AGAM|nr:hypothetical protein FA95DRAFT_1566842 [Auriscalpium vulgare]